MSSSIYIDEILSYLSRFRSIIKKETNITNMQKLFQKLSFFESFTIIGWNEELQKRYIDFVDFIDHQDFESSDKVDFMITFGIMMNEIPMMHFDRYSNEALLLCTSVMKDVSFGDYYFLGSFLCNKQIVDYVMKQQSGLEEQLLIYQNSIDGCVTCLSDFLVSLNLKKIVNEERLYNGIILIMKNNVERYVSYMNLSESEIQYSLRKKCEYGIR